MGNRAYVVDVTGENAIYLHWNGGRDSVEAFLEYGKLRDAVGGIRDDYGIAWLTAVIVNFMGQTGVTVGVVPAERAVMEGDSGNGTYVLNGWAIINRLNFKDRIEQNVYDRDEMLRAIDQAQPEAVQLGEAFLNAESVNTSDLEVGDEVFIMDRAYQKIEKHRIVGIGEPGRVWREHEGVPYIAKYGKGNPADNPNNYVRAGSVRRVSTPPQFVPLGEGLASLMDLAETQAKAGL